MRSKPVRSTHSFPLLLLLPPASCPRVLCDGLISYMVKWTLSFPSYFRSSCFVTAIQTPTKIHTKETMKVEMLPVWETGNTNFVALYYYSVGYSSESHSCLSFPHFPHACLCPSSSAACMPSLFYLSHACLCSVPFAACMPSILSAPCMCLPSSICCMHAPPSPST